MVKRMTRDRRIGSGEVVILGGGGGGGGASVIWV